MWPRDGKGIWRLLPFWKFPIKKINKILYIFWLFLDVLYTLKLIVLGRFSIYWKYQGEKKTWVTQHRFTKGVININLQNCENLISVLEISLVANENFLGTTFNASRLGNLFNVKPVQSMKGCFLYIYSPWGDFRNTLQSRKIRAFFCQPEFAWVISFCFAKWSMSEHLNRVRVIIDWHVQSPVGASPVFSINDWVMKLSTVAAGCVASGATGSDRKWP